MKAAKTNRLEEFLDSKLIPLGNKVSQQRHLKGIRDGMVAATPLALLGGMTLIVTSPPVNLDTMKPTNFLFQFLIAWKKWAVANGMQIELLYRATMGLMALFICLAIAHSMAKTYKMDPVGTMIVSAVCFMIASAPSNMGVMASGITADMTIKEVLEKQSVLMPTGFLGAEGIFTAIIIALLTTEITRLLTSKGLVIKMPDAVPAPVKASFASITPLIVNAVGVFLISLLAQKLSHGLLIPELIKAVFQPLVVAVDSPFGIIIISLVTQVLWLVGLHGSSIVSGVVGAFELGNLTANAALVTQGLEPHYIYTEPFRAFFMILGGAGATIALNILMLRSRSKQLKTLGRLAIVPSVFNINEPLIFGTPIVLNPTLAIPFILAQTVNGLLTYLIMYLDIIGKTFTYVPWTTPAPLGAMLSTLDVKAFIWIILLIVVDLLIWFPFFKSYEKQLILEDKELEDAQRKESGLNGA